MKLVETLSTNLNSPKKQGFLVIYAKNPLWPKTKILSSVTHANHIV